MRWAEEKRLRDPDDVFIAARERREQLRKEALRKEGLRKEALRKQAHGKGRKENR